MNDRKAMQKALEALELLSQQPIEMALDYADNAIDALRERLAHCDRCGKKLGGPDHIHTCSPQVQEPVALPCCGYADASAIKWNPYNQVVQCHNCGQTYTTPPQRKPLTHPQIHEFDWPDGVSFDDILLFVRAIEAAHGITGGQHG